LSEIPFLARVRHLFLSRPGDHFESLVKAFSNGELTSPVHPMSDQELAHAIREFQARPVSEWTVRKLGKRLAASGDAPRAKS
jgi:hypothetical protein